jgi:hypothetical protein
LHFAASDVDIRRGEHAAAQIRGAGRLRKTLPVPETVRLVAVGRFTVLELVVWPLTVTVA